MTDAAIGANNPLEDSLFELIKNHNVASRKLVEESVRIGMQFGMAKLDQAWAEINAQGGSSHNVDVYTQGYLDAIDDALEIIEKLGGMDPLKRARDFKEPP